MAARRGKCFTADGASKTGSDWCRWWLWWVAVIASWNPHQHAVYIHNSLGIASIFYLLAAEPAPHVFEVRVAQVAVLFPFPSPEFL
jgi:predicted phosphatase